MPSPPSSAWASTAAVRSGVARAVRIWAARPRSASCSSPKSKSMAPLPARVGEAETEHGDQLTLDLVRPPAEGQDEVGPVQLLELRLQNGAGRPGRQVRLLSDHLHHPPQR